MTSMILKGLFETLLMTVASSFFSYLIGIPLGVILVVTDNTGIKPMPKLNGVLGMIINLIRSVPFMILLIMVIPLTRIIVGTSIGPVAVIPPLVIAAAPYIARMVESSLKEVDAGVIEAAKSMGASNAQIIFKVLLPESKPSLLVGAAISVTTILGNGRIYRWRRSWNNRHKLRILQISDRYNVYYRSNPCNFGSNNTGDFYEKFKELR